MSESLINVVLFSDNANLSKYNQIEKDKKLNLAGYTNEFNKLKAFLILYKKAVIVVDESVINDNNTDEILSYINSRGNSFVVSSTKYIQATIIQKFNFVDVIYKNQYVNQDDFNSAICAKIFKVYTQVGINQTSSVDSMKYKPKFESSIDNNTFKHTISKESSRITDVKIPRTYVYKNESLLVKHERNKKFSKTLAIGASTGGPDTILKIIKRFPAGFSYPILIVQHMPEHFTQMFANRMNNECQVTVVEACDGDPIFGGCAYVAPGGKQMIVEEIYGNYFIKILPLDSNYVNNPSVDVTFNSVAENFGAKSVGVILTGMGKDGAKGLLNMRKNGAYTIGQDESSAVVYGMQKVAYETGAVKEQLHLDEIANRIMSILK